jgi:anti-sigma regulatory factor (Ser/Thr protein kinase)
VIDPSTGELTYATAGHPPPLLVSPDGEVTTLEEGRGPPIGAVAEPAFSRAEARAEPGATILLYTDGIAERRDMWIDEGIERLSTSARAVADRAPDDLLDHLTRDLLGEDATEDDVALLALRLDPPDAGALLLDLPAEPTVLASMRQALRSWLAGVGAAADDVYDILVATTEAAANSVEHAYGPVDASFRVEVRPGPAREVTVRVIDNGHWRPPRGQNRGRGTMLMQELMDDFEVATGDSGTEVTMRKRLAGAIAA